MHAYEGIDLERVWRIIQHDLPKLKDALEKILPPLEELERDLAESETDEEESKE
ncbi:MAG: HepT-like ribonuclease domain-containing protein [Candidatus Binatia bacterium]